MAGRAETSCLFVYGSLLAKSLREELLGRAITVAPAILPDYVVQRSRYFYIMPQPGAATRGLLLLKLSARDFDVLDCYEEVPILYTREPIAVVEAGGVVKRCWVYLPTPLATSGE